MHAFWEKVFTSQLSKNLREFLLIRDGRIRSLILTSQHLECQERHDNDLRQKYTHTTPPYTKHKQTHVDTSCSNRLADYLSRKVVQVVCERGISQRCHKEQLHCRNSEQPNRKSTSTKSVTTLTCGCSR